MLKIPPEARERGIYGRSEKQPFFCFIQQTNSPYFALGVWIWHNIL